MATDAQLLTFALLALAHLAIPLTLAVMVIWTHVTGRALLEHTRVHHPRVWREAGGPERGPLLPRLSAAQPARRRTTWERQITGTRVLWSWALSAPHRARECPEFQRLQRWLRIATLVPLVALVAALVSISVRN